MPPATTSLEPWLFQETKKKKKYTPRELNLGFTSRGTTSGWGGRFSCTEERVFLLKSPSGNKCTTYCGLQGATSRSWWDTKGAFVMHKTLSSLLRHAQDIKGGERLDESTRKATCPECTMAHRYSPTHSLYPLKDATGNSSIQASV